MKRARRANGASVKKTMRVQKARGRRTGIYYSDMISNDLNVLFIALNFTLIYL